MLMDARPPRKWTIVGDGMATLTKAFLAPALSSCDWTNLKSSTWIGLVHCSLPETLSVGGLASSSEPSRLLETLMPETCWRKSSWTNQRRRARCDERESRACDILRRTR